MFRNKFAKLILILILLMPSGQVYAARQQAAASAWYVSPAGSDANTCLSPAAPCATINAAIFRAEINQVVQVAVGSYVMGETGEGVSLNRSIHLQGGWDAGFTAQNGRSTLLDYRGLYDYRTHYGIRVYSGVTASLDGFDVIGVQEGLVNAGQLVASRITIRDSEDYGVINDGQNASLTISDATIRGNRRGGLKNSSNANLSLVNTTVYANRGGGISNRGALNLNNVTISGNSGALQGGGVYNFGSVSISNSIIAGNSAINEGQDCYGSFNSAGNNILGNPESCDFKAAGGDQVNVDPQLGTFLPALGYLPLKAGSPAIDAGNPANCAPTDQRGLPRVGLCDIGAYEYTAPGADVSISIFDGNPQHTPPNTAFPRPLRVLALDGQGSPVGGLAVTFTAPGSSASGVFAGSGSNSLVVNTDGSGMASVNLSANSLVGAYTVQAAASGLGALNFTMKNSNWYVSTLGSDANTCDLPEAPCASPEVVPGKPGFLPGDVIRVATGTYTGAGGAVFGDLGINLTLSGGWDESFSHQVGFSTADGQHTREGFSITSKAAVIERFNVINANIAVYQWQNGGSLTLRQCILKGGVIESHYGRLVIDQCALSGSAGPGIWMFYNPDPLEMTNSVVYGNGGAGLRIDRSSAVISNSTISGNANRGIEAVASNVTLRDSTISGNSASASYSVGGGIYSAWDSATSAPPGVITLQNTILAGNSAATGPDCYSSDPVKITSAGHTILGNTNGCAYNAAASDQLNVDPKLGVFLPAQGYYPLTAGSPAIDAGDPATCTSTDQRGLPRVGVCDIGAYEFRLPGAASSLIYFSGSEQRAAPNKTFVLPLRAVVLDGQGTPVSGVSVTFTAPGSGASGTFAGSGTSTVNSDGSGVAASALLTANNQLGAYTVTAAASGLGAVNFSLLNRAWYVSNAGSDSNTCDSPAAPCATINAAINKPDMQAGDTVLVAVGTYTGVPHKSVVYIPKSLTLSGGWNANFTSQVGISTIDSQVGNAGANVGIQVTAVMERFALINGVYGLKNLGTLTLEQCSITGNGIGPDHDPAIYTTGDLTINHSTISGNKGGGIQVGSNYAPMGTLTINDSTISGNSIPANLSTPGGGLNVNPGTVVTITNSTISGNSASTGGAIYTSGGVIVLRNTTITNNAVTNNGASGIQTSEPYSYPGSISMQNSILAGNSQNLGGSECRGTIHSLGHNLVGVLDIIFCNFISAAGDQSGDILNPADPLLTPLQDNGGPTLTHGFASVSSPAIDRGDLAACPASDQTGNIRPYGDGCDIGSVENTLPVVHIGGNAGVPGAMLHFTNEKPLTIAADVNGDYLLSLPPGWSGTVTPTRLVYTFDPLNRTYNSLSANQTGQDYIATFVGGVQDPGFEFTSDPFNSYWDGSSTNSLTTLCYVTTCGYGNGSSAPRSGQGWARLGGTASTERSEVVQYLVFPISRPNLKFQFYLWTGAAGAGSGADDRFDVVLDHYKVLFSTNASQRSLYSGYTPVQLDVSAYSDGKLHSLAFVSETSGQVVTFNVDDVSFNDGIFFDVPQDYWARSWIETLANNGVTGGCASGPRRYCPGNSVTRAEMAVFLLRGMHGSTYSPPAATGTVFSDVPINYWAAAWIEQLAKEGITGGCAPGKYCPDSPVFRDQMAVFLLRGMHGSTYSPPAATGTVFSDVSGTYWAAAWIEQLAKESITGGCAPGKYCPGSLVFRDQMAVFLVRAFGLK